MVEAQQRTAMPPVRTRTRDPEREQRAKRVGDEFAHLTAFFEGDTRITLGEVLISGIQVLRRSPEIDRGMVDRLLLRIGYEALRRCQPTQTTAETAAQQAKADEPTAV
jgi:hypothetical protein